MCTSCEHFNNKYGIENWEVSDLLFGTKEMNIKFTMKSFPVLVIPLQSWQPSLCFVKTVLYKQNDKIKNTTYFIILFEVELFKYVN